MQPTVPYPWGDYLSLQRQVASTTYENTRSRGSDEVLTALLEKSASSSSSANSDPALPTFPTTLCDNRSAKYRHRLRIERRHATELSPVSFTINIVDELATQYAIARIRKAVESSDWELLQGLAEGESFSSIAKNQRASVASLKSRASRLRKRLREGVLKDVLREVLAA